MYKMCSWWKPLTFWRWWIFITCLSLNRNFYKYQTKNLDKLTFWTDDGPWWKEEPQNDSNAPWGRHDYVYCNPSNVLLRYFTLNPQILISLWCHRKSQGNTKVIRIHSVGNMNVYANFYGNPSDQCWYPLSHAASMDEKYLHTDQG